ncbi:MAG: DUF4234 domain-containing protein [Candidatus Woesearchaeota archaeon]|jgi:hypothetical protein|nr:DUF4234 domain-containing protein [Candidatus Woesearchaeota archaeon]MDP7181434.1 DUF4234 domain-containing protein [Candidatus Woesearchaeota archaeon]MDP7198476.1 DUF4234 domain-containing protein [Candidatus Woesearchaeota archaeon]MDP7466782.1 DUF4234 domain-containing protein [Candidatus Woesearchaeota archaeon]MDP7648007.1 DUF4234 domain-containing protein [Candidatus Woesearchaeota archaeon]|tara:strand:- start:239 stop:733 length:495 start_codon:yes stop_codon:yes gene_type:complete
MDDHKLQAYIDEVRSQGHKDDELKSHLLEHGYDTKAVDEALGPGPAAPPTTAHPPLPGMSGGFKHRNPALVLVFTIITLGIYGVYWLASTTNELKAKTPLAPSPYLLILFVVPLVGLIAAIVYCWKYGKALEEVTKFSGIGMLVLLLFVFPVAQVIAQMQLNKH